ncbi:MAG: hypothetical protein Kow00117_20050 [Phototrophicales bacterium]
MNDLKENPHADELPQDETSNTTRRPPMSDSIEPNFPSPSSGVVKTVDTLTFYIPGRMEPLVIQNIDHILIGRRDDEKGFYPTIDLVPYYGVMLGVSRRHAEITLEDGKCYLKDLNSANGTWLNQTKLTPNQSYPLNNGDQIRLGRLLMAVFLSYEGDIDTSPEVGRFLVTFRLPTQRKGMSPDDLVGLLGQYLKAVGDLQRLISTSGIITAPDVKVYVIRMDKDKTHVHVEMSIDAKLLEYIQTKLTQFLNQTRAEDAPILVDLVTQNFLSYFNLQHTADVIPPIKIIINSHLMIVTSAFANDHKGVSITTR